MKTEVCYSINRKIRVTEDNFWFRVERRSVLGWQPVSKCRDFSLSHNILIQEYWRMEERRINELAAKAESGVEWVAVAALEAKFVAATGRHVFRYRPWALPGDL